MDTSQDCDESGLCAEIRELKFGPNARSVAWSPRWSLLADASPLVTGHSLLVTARHIPRLSALRKYEFSRLSDQIDLFIRQFEAKFDSDVLLVEHGSSDNRQKLDCVRHAHLHVVPLPARLPSRSLDVVCAQYFEWLVVVRRWTDVLSGSECHPALYLGKARRSVYDRPTNAWSSADIETANRIASRD